MVTIAGFRSGFRSDTDRTTGLQQSEIQDSGFRRLLWNLIPALPLCCLLVAGIIKAQMPANTPTFNVNAKWVTDRGSQVFNVKAYGAKCDGTTDDSAAFASALAAIPGGTAWPALNTVGGGTLFIPPSPTPCNLASARLAVTKSNVIVSGYGAVLLCTVSDDCMTLGSLTNATANQNIVVRGLSMEPGAGSAGHSAIRDNAQGSLIEDITNVVNYAEYPSFPGFSHFIENDNDQSETVRHIFTSGYYLNCDASFCGSTLWEPGPLATNAGITYLSDFNFAPMCHGNGIDWEDGNDLHVKGGVIQGYNQYSMRIAGGITRNFNINQVHSEIGSCTNPLGNVGIAGLIAIGANVSNFGGQAGGGVAIFPQAGTTANTLYHYYVVGKNSGGSATTPIAAGYVTNGNPTINPTNHITVTWNDFQQSCPTCTYDGLRYNPPAYHQSAPYGTGNWAVFTGLAESSICSNGVCTFVDTVTNPSSYTVSAGGGYSPGLSLWGGAVVLSAGASYTGDSLPLGGIFVSPDVPSPGRITLFGGPTNAYYQDLEPFNPVIVTALNSGTLYQPRNALAMDQSYIGGGTKGIINLGPAASPQDSITLVDSNPSKTFSVVSARPTYDAGDTAIGTDIVGLAVRSPGGVSQYLNSLPDNASWSERLVSGLKIFKVPLGAFSTAQLSAPFFGGISDIATGGTLSPNTQYCYFATTLDNLGESYHDRPEVCQTTANDGNSTHQVSMYFKSQAGQVRGYNVYGRTTGAEQLITPTPVPDSGGYWITFNDTGSVTPSGAPPTNNTTGKIRPALYSTATNCSSSASPAVCGSAGAGSVVIAAGATSVVVDTSAVTANSQILLTEDSSLGTRLGVTCNTQSLLTLGVPKVTARSAGSSFTASIEVGPTTNPLCISYAIFN
jgi:hypothetical protein